MSIESAKAFIERIKNDQDLAKRIEACKDREEFIALVKAEGYEFTVEDVKEVTEVTEELSDERLDSVVGGRTFNLTVAIFNWQCGA